MRSFSNLKSKGFYDIVIGSLLKSFTFVFFCHTGCKQYNGNVGPLHVCFDFADIALFHSSLAS